MFPATHIESRLIPKNSFSIKVIQKSLDIVILLFVFRLAYELRFDFAIPAEMESVIFGQMIVTALAQYAALHFFGVHKFIWRHVSLGDFREIVRALSLVSVPLFLLRFVLADSANPAAMPLSIIILDSILAVSGILGIRILRRAIYENMRATQKKTVDATGRKSVLLIGAGRAGALTLAQIKTGNKLSYTVKGFIDDDPLKQGLIINGVKVVGKTDDLSRKARELQIDEAIITVAQASRRDIRRILDICSDVGVKVKTIPGLSDLLEEKVTISRIRDVEVEDLLGRAPINLDRESIESFLRGKVVMVTGAGGSIGAELVRQLAGCQAEKLILVERSEFALFSIEREIAQLQPDCQSIPVLADIGDFQRMEGIFRRYRPQVIFHAAAHKHVPLMENNSAEAIKNNALGTKTIGQLAIDFGAEKFVLISTDKAVNPTSVMGASKRLAELIVQNLNLRATAKSAATRFIAVRFGNVINSNGSVIPIFRAQIKAGGPVTVTHPDMKRFFMTIPEASQLVLQAGALGSGGEIFVLDMGEPVKILDLARETIKLSGLEPDEDIQIVFTGVRPGEKLREELESDWEQLAPTAHPKIRIARIQASAPTANINKSLAHLEQLCAASVTEDDDFLIRSYLCRVLPEARLKFDSSAAAVLPERKRRVPQTVKLAPAFS